SRQSLSTSRPPRHPERRAHSPAHDKRRPALHPSNELSRLRLYRFAECNELRPRLPPCAVRRACRRSRLPQLPPSSPSGYPPVISSARVECASLLLRAGRYTYSAAARRESFQSASSSTLRADECDKSEH